MKSTPEQAAWQALRPFLNLAHLARELGLHRNATLKWTEVPEHFVERMSRVTGLPISVLRPSRYSERTLWDIIK